MSFGTQFLRHPDLFPNRLSGEAWGTDQLRFEIAGVPFLLSGLSSPQLELCNERYRDLLLPFPAEEGDVSLALYRAPASDFLDFDTAGWEADFDFDRTTDSLAWTGRGTMARFDRRSGTEAALWTPANGDRFFAGILENVLRVIVAYRAARAGGALLHSAAVLARDRAYLFVGRSGAGKSTLCGLSTAAGRRVLSDELNALSVDANGLRLQQLPFAGDFGHVAVERNPFPLAGIYLLRQGPEAALTAVSKARAVAALIAASPFVNIDPELSEQALTNIERIVEQVDPQELTFRLDPDFWSILLGDV